MKVTGMLVVSLRGINCRFCSRLEFTGRKANICTLYRYRLGLCVMKYLYEKTKRRQSLASIFSASKNHSNFYLVVCFGVVSFRVQITPEPRPDWSPLGV